MAMDFKCILLLLTMVCGTVVALRCPPEENLSPSCSCIVFGSVAMMTCAKIMNAEELIPPVKGTEGYDIFSINIEDSSLMYIPSGIFKNTKFEKIRFENSQVMSLSDSDLAFEGLENLLEEIRATGDSYVTTWDWDQLRNHKRLKLIDVNKISMYSLDNEFPHLDSLTALGISNAEISFIHPQAFRGLHNLDLLVLKNNEISEISRSMLPNPANKLYHIDLSNNLLITLPDDTFTKMPTLKEVKLDHNKFVTLKEEAFSGIFNSLQSLMINDNPIRCDCRLRWLVGQRTPLYFEGTCNEPESMHGVTLRYLKHNDLWCY